MRQSSVRSVAGSPGIIEATIDGSTEDGMDCRVTILTPSAVLSTVITLASGAPESSSRPAMKSGSLNRAKTSDAGASYCCDTFNGLGTDCAPDVGGDGWRALLNSGDGQTAPRTIITGRLARCNPQRGGGL